MDNISFFYLRLCGTAFGNRGDTQGLVERNALDGFKYRWGDLPYKKNTLPYKARIRPVETQNTPPSGMMTDLHLSISSSSFFLSIMGNFEHATIRV